MEEISQDQFKVNHLRNRIAQMSVAFEDSLADFTIRNQLLVQQVQELQAQNQELAQEILNRDEEIEELKAKLAAKPKATIRNTPAKKTAKKAASSS